MRAAAWALLIAVLSGLALVSIPSSASGATLVPISGAGSTWSQNAVEQWRRNVQQNGIRINFQGTGSSDGRNQFKNGTVDFAVSEIPYGQTDNNVPDPAPTNRNFAYMPIVAGGTAFMYNLKVGGKRVTNLRLSGENVAKIFTGVLKTWNDPAIAADNPGLALPARPIVPVVRSDGSGTTAQFTLWMSKQHPAIWGAYSAKQGRSNGPTSNYPAEPGMRALAGSLGVAGYVGQDQNEGTITYVEESYALNQNYPVVKVLNAAGYYVEPTANNVAVALQSAGINADLTQNLDGVYASRDKRTYPLSSYSYMIVPTAIQGPMNENKGYTLSKFARYFLCEGQQSVDKLGYSPLPRNLVQAGLDVVKKIPGYDTTALNIESCRNPTFGPGGVNLLAKNAPNPPECDRKGGPAQCTTGTGGAKQPTQTNNGGGGQSPTGGTGAPGGAGAPGAGAPGGVGTPGGGGAPTPLPGGAPPATGAVPPGGVVPGTTTAVDPGTGQPLVPAGQNAVAVPSQLTGGTGNGFNGVLVVFALLMLAGLVLGPPLAARSINRQNGGEQP